MTWSIGSDEKTNMKCQSCQVACDDLEKADHLFEDVPEKKTYIFWHESAQTQSFTTSTSSNFGVGVDATGPNANAGGSVSASQTITKGQALVKMFRRDNEGHMCALCFSKEHPIVFKSVAATLYGKKFIINIADMKLVNPEIGAF